MVYVYFLYETLTRQTNALFPSDHGSHHSLNLDLSILGLNPNPASLLPFGLRLHSRLLSLGSPWTLSAFFPVLIAGHTHSLIEIPTHHARHAFSSSCHFFSLVSLEGCERDHIYFLFISNGNGPLCSLPACSASLSAAAWDGRKQRCTRWCDREKQLHLSLLHHLLELHHTSKSGSHMISSWHRLFP